MRLLNTSTLVVEEFFAERVPEYVILSHTWADEEVTLQDMRSGEAHTKKGYPKVKGCCQKALSDGFDYCWVDTCCIDKTSSTELSEAINSMYKWYAASAICYVYLPDVTESFGPLVPNEITRYRNLGSARWFRRGWTLQELIAPAIVEFYDEGWRFIGTKLSLREQIAETTGIDRGVLRGKPPSSCNVAVRMSWASRRVTTRTEDEAYCLLGLFGVNMPLLYGEGLQAFQRLQEEILRVEEDYTLFVWNTSKWCTAYPTYVRYSTNIVGMLAHRPSYFGKFVAKTLCPSSSHDDWWPDRLSVDPFRYLPESEHHLPPQMTSRGVRLSLPLALCERENEFWACITMISAEGRDWHMLCVLLHRADASDDQYARILGAPPIIVPKSNIEDFERKLIYVTQFINQDILHRYSGIEKPTAKEHSARKPVFIIVKTKAINDEHVECSDQQMLSIKQISSSSEPSLNQFSSDFLLRGDLAMKLRPGSKTLSHLTMGSDPSACYIHKTNTVTLVAFRLQALQLAFVVRFNIADNGPWCNVWCIESNLYDDFQLDSNKEAFARHTKEPRSDFVALDAKAGTSSFPFNVTVRVTVNVRRVATAMDFPRYTISAEVGEDNGAGNLRAVISTDR